MVSGALAGCVFLCFLVLDVTVSGVLADCVSLFFLVLDMLQCQVCWQIVAPCLTICLIPGWQLWHV